MAIIYLHGFASSVKTQSKKYDALNEIASVNPFAPDYPQGFEQVMQSCMQFTKAINSVSAVVGTSMGGYTASHLASRLNLPFVARAPIRLKKTTGITINRWPVLLDHYTWKKRALIQNIKRPPQV